MYDELCGISAALDLYRYRCDAGSCVDMDSLSEVEVPKTMNDPITFLASFPPIQSAIKRGNDGMRIQLDIPESEVVNAIPLLALQNVTLRITVDVCKDAPKAVDIFLENLLNDLEDQREDW